MSGNASMGGWSTTDLKSYQWYNRQLRRECGDLLSNQQEFEHSLCVRHVELSEDDDRLGVVEEMMDSEAARSVIEIALAELTFREREVLKLRYGIGYGCAHTLKEAARLFGVSANRIRQIQAKAIRKLQHPTRAKCLKPYASAMGLA